MRWIGVTRIASASRWWWQAALVVVLLGLAGPAFASNPLYPRVQDWLWASQSRDTQIRWVMLGHSMSPAPGELERYTEADRERAAAIVDAYDQGVAPPTPPVVPPTPPVVPPTPPVVPPITPSTQRYVGALVVTASPAPNASGELGYVLTVADASTLWLPADTFEIVFRPLE